MVVVYFFYNVTLGKLNEKKISYTNDHWYSDLDILGNDAIISIFKKVISANKDDEWKDNHVIRASPDINCYDFITYRNGNITFQECGCAGCP